MRLLTQSLVLVALASGLGGCPFDQKYTVGGLVTGLAGSGLVLQDNSGNNLSVTANGSFVFSSNVTNGKAYSISVLTPPSNPSQTCTPQNAAGTIAKANVTTVLVSCKQAGRYAYIANQQSSDISAVSITAGSSPGTNVALTPIIGSPFFPGNTRTALAVEPNGNYLYAISNSTNVIEVFTISAGGALTRTSSTIATGSGPVAIAIHPTAKYLYVANFTAKTLSGYSIQASGQLTQLSTSPFNVSSEPNALQIDAAGNHLYVTLAITNNIAVYSVDSSNGNLTSVPGSPFGTNIATASLAIAPNDTFIYSTSPTATTIYGFSISSAGALSPISNPTLPTSSSPSSITVDQSGQCLLVANNQTNQIAAYSIASTGVLTSSVTATTGTTPVSVASDPTASTVDSTRSNVYVVNQGSNSVSVFSLYTGTTGNACPTLTPVGSAFSLDGKSPSAIVID